MQRMQLLAVLGLIAAVGTIAGPRQLEAQNEDTGYGQGRGVSSAAKAAAPPAANAVTFRVRIENISQGKVLKGSNGGEAPFAIAPGLWVVHKGKDPLFTTGKLDRGKGLEPLAEDGAPGKLAESLKGRGVLAAGVFDTPQRAASPGPAGPGAAFEFTVTATPGSRLSYAEMFGQSNDLFYAPGGKGIALFDRRGRPISGDVTDQITLWDSGTEVNQEPGFGPDQAPRQAAPNTGAGERKPVGPVQDGFTYPPVSQVLRVTITPAS